MTNGYYPSMQTLISQAKRSEEWAYLSGSPPLEEGEVYIRPYDVLLMALKEAVEQVEFLKGHQHVWDEGSYCIHCGNDGRA